MMDQSKLLQMARNRVMQNRKVICTGNPNRENTLAHGLKKLFPDAVFLCRGTGWDLTDSSPENRQRLAEVFAGKNTFLNFSFIAPGVQSWLLEICHDTCKFCDVVNIGSSYEFDPDVTNDYKKSKVELRHRSMALDTFRFSTCHFVLGGIRTDNAPEKQTWLSIDAICAQIVWLWDQPFNIPIMSMYQPKQPW